MGRKVVQERIGPRRHATERQQPILSVVDSQKTVLVACALESGGNEKVELSRANTHRETRPELV